MNTVYATLGVIIRHFKVILVAALAIFALVLVVQAAGPDYTEAEQGLIDYSHSIGIRPLGDDGGAETILNIADPMCDDPDALRPQLVPYEAWDNRRAYAFSYYVYGEYCSASAAS